ncbi:hypothetical protein [Mycobacteroides abscessus]|uniref:hypothetical protein n=1 Tax=Mycobacteroides abscessus TaxID=36809 RepID=UPI00266BC674|nr:hypothetical protein [Mycobacteroides abscessus]MDO3331335.1 hypothetical protein [Mycobacteroides abscessus subsp. abscessus]
MSAEGPVPELSACGPFAPAFANAVIAVLVRRYPGLQIGVDELAAAARTGIECVYDPESGVWRFAPIEASVESASGGVR